MPYNGWVTEPEYLREYLHDSELEFYRAQAAEMEKINRERRMRAADRMQFTAAQADSVAQRLANWGISPIQVGRALERWELGMEGVEGTPEAVCFRAFAEYQRQETEGR